MGEKPKRPEDIPASFAKAWKERDAAALAGLFAEDADFINVTGLHWDNRGDIRRAHDFGFRVIFKDSELRILGVKVRRLSPGAAIVHADMELRDQTDLEGEKSGLKRRNRMVFVAVEEKDGWVCVSAQNSEVLTGAQTFLRKADGTVEAVYYGRPVDFASDKKNY